MESRFILPAELAEDASISGNEYGWPPASFPDVAIRAESLGYACLGGQFQFRMPFGIYEMYWLAADSSDRRTEESWLAFCARSRSEVLEKFRQIVGRADFLEEALKSPGLKREIDRGLDIIKTLVFVAYFVSESSTL